MMSPQITVLIPTFNRSEYLAECLESILAQTCPASQILVINDGSTDRTLEVVKPYLNAIEYVETPQLGKPGALNFGLKRIKGDYLWIFDDDDVALPDALERFVTPLEQHPENGFSYSPFFFTNTDPETNKIGAIMSELKIPNFESKGFLIELLERNFLGGAALFARTSCYHVVGDFDSRLVRSQDYEMAIRIARRFKGVRVNGGSTFHYRQHSGFRGSHQDRFSITDRDDKWLHYDGIFFRCLYHELPLDVYLPPGQTLADHIRRSLLQRMKIMATRLLTTEAISDLRIIATLNDPSPFSRGEKAIIWDMVNEIPNTSNFQKIERTKFLNEIRRLADFSAVIGLLREEMIKETFWRFKLNPTLFQIKNIGRRVSRLYSLKKQDAYNPEGL